MEHKTHKDNVYVMDFPRSPVSEAFRSLRANVEFASSEKQVQTILVTSATPGEGKTTISTNLAMVFAQSGKRVLLIDADMRRPKIHYQLGLTNEKGFSDLLAEPELIETIIQHKKDSKLDVITSGSHPANPSELLASEGIDVFFENVKRRANIIIFDSPPTIVSDAAILSSKVDGVLLVVKPGVTHRSTLQAIVEQTSRSGARILGVIFNYIPRNRMYYYGKYRHAVGYYYSGHQRYHAYYQETPSRKEAPNGHHGSNLWNLSFLNRRKDSSNGIKSTEDEFDINDVSKKN